jgi:pyrroloquinoline quinone (PQQ) biosynthesis protein C
MNEIEALMAQKLDRKIIYHPLLSRVRAKNVKYNDVQMILEQYWHPIKFFPKFLATAVAQSNFIDTQTQISKILYQELGEGNSKRAHPEVYLESMALAGFNTQSIQKSETLSGTRDLMAGFKNSLLSEYSSYGFIYGTELIDLALVSGIGQAVRDVSGIRMNEWIDVHVEQEPDHVASASIAVTSNVGATHHEEILNSVTQSLALWTGFLDHLEQVIRDSE